MRDENWTTGLACVGLLISVPTVIVLSALVNGWALSVMWGWFVVPLFHLPAMSIVYAIGFSLVVGMFKPNTSSHDTRKKDTRELVTAVIAEILSPVLVVGIGWIVKLFI